MAIHRGRLSLRPEPRQVARAQRRKLPVSLRARGALGLVCAAVFAAVCPGTPRAQEAFREVSLTRDEGPCCWPSALTLAAVDEPPASPAEKKPRWLLAGLLALLENAGAPAPAPRTFDPTP